MTNSPKLPDAFRRIHLELAREPGHPAGDSEERYTLVAPLLEDGRIDADLVRQHQAACRVVRKHEGEVALGHLVHGPGGRWRFAYDIAGEVADEKGFHLENEHLRAGEYVSIVRENTPHPFRVTAVVGV